MQSVPASTTAEAADQPRVAHYHRTAPGRPSRESLSPQPNAALSLKPRAIRAAVGGACGVTTRPRIASPSSRPLELFCRETEPVPGQSHRAFRRVMWPPRAQTTATPRRTENASLTEARGHIHVYSDGSVTTVSRMSLVCRCTSSKAVTAGR